MIEQNVLNSIDGWYFSKEEISECLKNGHMLNPSIDLSNKCNLNCPYCYVEDKDSLRKTRHDDELTFNQIINVIDELHSCGAKTINIVGAGEPTIDTDFEEIIEHINKNKIKTVLFTNGIRLYNETTLAKFLQKNNVSVVIKYNSINPDIQDLLVGRHGYTQKRDATLEMLIDLGFNSHYPTKLGIDVIVNKGNYREVPQILNWCRENNIFPIIGGYIPAGRTSDGFFCGFNSIKNQPLKTQKRIISLLQPINIQEKKELLLQLKNIDKSFNIHYPNNPAYYCGGICTQTLGLYITFEGEIFPCIAKKIKVDEELNAIVLGNIKKGDSLQNIWNENFFLMEVRKNFNGSCIYKN
jgi:MoaA/NifB/PqqE/SkfB family radical SAM enzyme